MKLKLLRLGGALSLVALLSVSGWATLAHWQAARVTGGSMRPSLTPGDLVVVDRSVPARAGQIALVGSARHGRYLHRIAEVDTNGLLHTRGDANAVADFDEVPLSAVVGPVVLVLPLGKLVERWRGSGAYATMTAQQNSARP